MYEWDHQEGDPEDENRSIDRRLPRFEVYQIELQPWRLG